MRRRAVSWVLIFIVLAAAVFLLVRGGNDGGAPYAAFTTNEMGTSVFFDTLRHMGYPVRIGYAPLTAQSDTNHVFVLIQPFNPAISREMADEILDWVRAGGRLIFLHNQYPNILDRTLSQDGYLRRVDELFFYHYTVGYGALITGRAHHLTNRQIITDHARAAALHAILRDWNPQRIYFPVYYHGVHPPDTAFSRLPLIIRLTLIQFGIAIVLLIWHFGKRFGRAIPVYEETEREENEQVRAMARLYKYTKKERILKNAENSK